MTAIEKLEESKIDNAMQALKQAILEEMNQQTVKHRLTRKESEKRQRVIDEVAHILHNIPRMKHDKEEKDVEKAWNILDKARTK